jgi:hypothetical protein
MLETMPFYFPFPPLPLEADSYVAKKKALMIILWLCSLAKLAP